MKIKALHSNDSICWKALSLGHYSVSFWVNFKVVKSLLSVFTRTRNAPAAL